MAGTGLGMASLALQVGDCVMRLKSFWDAVKDAPEEIKHLIDEIETLSLVLSGFETNESSEPEPMIGHEATSRYFQFCKKAVGILEAVAKQVEAEIKKRRRAGSMKAVLKKSEIEKLRERLMTAQSMLMLSNNLCLLELQKRNRQAHHDWAKAHQQELQQLRIVVSQSTEKILSSASFQTPSQRLLTAAETVPPCESKSFSTNGARDARQMTSFRSKRRKLKARIQTPKWLFGVSRAIEIYESGATAGWNFNIQVYNVVPFGSPQFGMARLGDLVGIQHLFSTGQASPFDRGPSGYTILDLEFCRLLMNEGADPNISAFGTALDTACLAEVDPSCLGTLEGLIYLLAQNVELLDPFEETSKGGKWVAFCLNTETFTWLLQASNSTHQNRSLEECVIFAIAVCRHESRDMWGKMRIILNGREIDKDLCGIHDTADKTTLLHCAARNLGSLFSGTFGVQEALRKDLQHLGTLIRDLVKGGSNLHFLSLQGLTPMLEVLRGLLYIYRGCPYGLIAGNEDSETLKFWLKELQDSGVDLESYGRDEKLLLRTEAVAREWRYSWTRMDLTFVSRKLRLINFTYGPELDDWKFWFAPVMPNYFMDFWEMIGHPERAMPGAWEEEYYYDYYYGHNE
ncbi:hypothetical protein BGZ57DRAFT_854509 [Hyaloscypha finlandica]|nr:hypothetical protein BGZ57DRAFT_854509 [Hyaloscypha finlandica]